MKPTEIREKSSDELRAMSSELRDELFRLRMQLYTGQLEKPSKIRETRKDIARIETILSERTSAAE